MKNANFSKVFLFDQSPEQVFDAINNVRGWWSEALEGESDALGATFTYRHKDLHRSTHTVTELVPGRRVAWHVSDSQLSFVATPTEWTGTDVTFDIAKRGAKTELRFTHVGLSPALECFGACSRGWGFYVGESLRGLIAEGVGQPDR